MTKRELRKFRLRFLSLCLKLEEADLEAQKMESRVVLPEPVTVDAQNLFRDFDKAVNDW